MGSFKIKASSHSGAVLLWIQQSVQRFPFLKNISSFILQLFHPIDHFLANKTENISPQYVFINLALIQLVSYEQVVLSFLLPLLHGYLSLIRQHLLQIHSPATEGHCPTGGFLIH